MTTEENPVTTIPTPRDLLGAVSPDPAPVPLRSATEAELVDLARVQALSVHAGLTFADGGPVPGLPVLDAPARVDEPKPAPRRRGVVVEVRALDATGAPTTREVIFETATRWSIAPAGALRVYDGPTEEKAFNQHVWVSVDWLYDAVPATREAADR